MQKNRYYQENERSNSVRVRKEERYQQCSAGGSGARKSRRFTVLGMEPTPREMLRRQLAFAAGKKSSVQLSLLLENL